MVSDKFCMLYCTCISSLALYVTNRVFHSQQIEAKIRDYLYVILDWATCYSLDGLSSIPLLSYKSLYPLSEARGPSSLCMNLAGPGPLGPSFLCPIPHQT